MRHSTITERFWSKVQKTETCWLWTAYYDRIKCGGYGRINFNGKPGVLAHRAAWMLTNGPIPAGLCVLHRCDTPRCVRPDHLFLGTNADNMADRDAKGRRHAPRGEASGSAKITEAQVRFIRAELAKGRGCPTLAAQFGLDRTTIWQIGKKKLWAHVI
jgi:hypothetical protein